MRITVEVTEHTDTPIHVEEAANEYLDASWADEYARLLALAARTAREAESIRTEVRAPRRRGWLSTRPR